MMLSGRGLKLGESDCEGETESYHCGCQHKNSISDFDLQTKPNEFVVLPPVVPSSYGDAGGYPHFFPVTLRLTIK